mmetsp:Transcript_26769/g.77888  ORF Transcript_26769/g.77888 Transcript_26769/m.77888 type:complete len:271 (-) Transcript_26769:122-934(-)
MASSSPEMPDEAPDGASSEGGFSEAARPATKKAPRPPGKPPAGKEWDSDAGCWKEIDDLPISDLEKRRLKQIEENEARLLALGLGPSPLIDKAPRRKSHKRTWEVDEDVKGSLRARKKTSYTEEVHHGVDFRVGGEKAQARRRAKEERERAEKQERLRLLQLEQEEKRAAREAARAEREAERKQKEEERTRKAAERAEKEAQREAARAAAAKAKAEAEERKAAEAAEKEARKRQKEDERAAALAEKEARKLSSQQERQQRLQRRQWAQRQ